MSVWVWVWVWVGLGVCTCLCAGVGVCVGVCGGVRYCGVFMWGIYIYRGGEYMTHAPVPYTLAKNVQNKGGRAVLSSVQTSILTA